MTCCAPESISACTRKQTTSAVSSNSGAPELPAVHLHATCVSWILKCGCHSCMQAYQQQGQAGGICDSLRWLFVHNNETVGIIHWGGTQC